ncbi:Hypothetical protein NTJ_13314 [Nesidiocoris tenuis]|uniref:Uncharacterized protein n=1 Tax=Nesidiocoris tenuis TaxID=355587 RepID=A0ABN7B7Z1_9HEMI|nr:Hypothetical protein NTJ_13314 [Nesidiocoris tenuis]
MTLDRQAKSPRSMRPFRNPVQGGWRLTGFHLRREKFLKNRRRPRSEIRESFPPVQRSTRSGPAEKRHADAACARLFTAGPRPYSMSGGARQERAAREWRAPFPRRKS